MTEPNRFPPDHIFGRYLSDVLIRVWGHDFGLIDFDYYKKRAAEKRRLAATQKKPGTVEIFQNGPVWECEHLDLGARPDDPEGVRLCEECADEFQGGAELVKRCSEDDPR